MKKIDELTMINMNIHELRNFARSIGVNSPTLLKKEDLIQEIKAVQDGEKPTLPRTRRGRPPKAKKVSQKKIVEDNVIQEDYSVEDREDNENYEVFTDEDLINNPKYREKYDFSEIPEEYVMWNLNASSPEYEDLPYDLFDGSGYLKLMSRNRFFLFGSGNSSDVSKAIIVENKKVEENCLREGDFVNCVYRQILGNAIKVLEKVKDSQLYKNRPDFNNIKKLEIKENKILALNFTSEKILEGAKNVLLLNSFGEYNSALKDFKNLSKEYKFVNFAIEVFENEEYNFDGSFYTLIGDSLSKSNFIIDLALAHIKRLVERGEKVIVLANELVKFVIHNSSLMGYNIGDINKNIFSICSKIYSLAGIYENGASVTIFGVLVNDSNNKYTQFVLNETRNEGINIIQYK